MESKYLLALFVVGLLAFSAASDGDDNGSDSGSESVGSFEDSWEQKDEDCDRLVEGSDENEGKCDLTDGLEELPDEIECTEEERTIIIDWIVILKGLLAVTKSVQERLIIALSSIQKFQMENPTLYERMQYQNVSSWGYLASFTKVVQYRQSMVMESLITLDDDDNCELFDALFNCTDGSYEQESAINALINETLIDICGNFSLTATERYVLIYEAFAEFFAINSEWQMSFFQFEIVGFGSFQQFFEITRTFYQVTQVDVIFESEDVAECQFMISFKTQLTLIYEDSSIPSSIKSIMREFYDVCLQELAKSSSGKGRLAILIKTIRSFLSLYSSNKTLCSYIFDIQIDGVGSIFDIINCAPHRNGFDSNPTPTISVSTPKPTCGCTCEPVTIMP